MRARELTRDLVALNLGDGVLNCRTHTKRAGYGGSASNLIATEFKLARIGFKSQRASLIVAFAGKTVVAVVAEEYEPTSCAHRGRSIDQSGAHRQCLGTRRSQPTVDRGAIEGEGGTGSHRDSSVYGGVVDHVDPDTVRPPFTRPVRTVMQRTSWDCEVDVLAKKSTSPP